MKIEKWLINKIMKLEGNAKYGKDLGEIYVQMRFIKECDIENVFAQ